MKLEAFEHILTYKDLVNKLNFMRAVAEERSVPFENMLKIDDYEDIGLSYMLSSIRNNSVVQNFFEYARGSLKGIYYMKSVTKSLCKMTEPIYTSFIHLHNRAWLCLKPDSTYDLWVNEQFVTDGIIGYDSLDLCGYVYFIQLNFHNSKGLICCDNLDAMEGVFIPKNKREFIKYFNDLLYSRGYEGKFDEMKLSDIFQVFYEVCNCIFESSTYKSVVS